VEGEPRNGTQSISLLRLANAWIHDWIFPDLIFPMQTMRLCYVCLASFCTKTGIIVKTDDSHLLPMTAIWLA